MVDSIYTSTISFNGILTKSYFFDRLQKEIEGLKKCYVYTDPQNAAYLIKWEIELPDYSFVREDF